MTYPTTFQVRTPGLCEPATDKPPQHAPADAPRMEHHERSRLRAAAFRAKHFYPGPVGELISRELLAWEEFGWRLARGALVMELVAHIDKLREGQAS